MNIRSARAGHRQRDVTGSAALRVDIALRFARARALGVFICFPLAFAGCSRKPAPANVSDLTQAVYADSGGWNGGDGSLEHPWDLGTALSTMSTIRPGGTVWLRGGTYRGVFVSDLKGTEHGPITVRPMAGERVVLDGAKGTNPVLSVNGEWTVIRDIEITNSDPRRVAGPGTPDINRLVGVDVHGPHTKLVNLVVHDVGIGLGLWTDAVDAEAYGNIVYHNGWSGQDRPHGHGIYTQNRDGVRRLTDNVIFRQFDMGIHAYGSEDAYLDSITLEGNVIFNNGLLTEVGKPGETYQNNILIGGGRRAKKPVLKSNYTYFRPEHGGSNTVGSGPGCEDLLMRDNYFAGLTSYAIELVNCSGTVHDNEFVGLVRGIEGRTIVPMPELAARYSNNRFPQERPTGIKTFVRQNRFEPGRAHIIVYNWAKAPEVQTDLRPAGIPVGSRFEIRDVQDLSGPSVVSGTYGGGSVTIPLRSATVAPVVGWSSTGLQATPPHTQPEFGVFLLTMSPDSPSRIASLVARLRGLVGL